MLPLFKYLFFFFSFFLHCVCVHADVCFTCNKMRALFCSADGLEHLYCISQLGLAVKFMVIILSAISCVTFCIMYNGLSQRLRVLKWPQKESHSIYTIFIYIFFPLTVEQACKQSIYVSKCIFIHMQDKCDGMLLRLKDRCDARQL